MEQNFPIVAKKFWNIFRVAYFMLRKNISKPKLLADLNMMMKRGKLAGKAAIHNLIHHHHHNSGSDAVSGDHQISPEDYEFSCTDTPPPDSSDADLSAAAVEIFGEDETEAASPAIPWFGRSPMVRQLRITDSPFPLREIEEDGQVDEAAEKFITKFYSDLMRQNTMAT